MSIRVLNAPASELGEGIFLHHESMMLYWVDINSGTLYQYDINTEVTKNKYVLGKSPSCILSANETMLRYLDNEGVKELTLASGKVEVIGIYQNHCSKNNRANDGVLLPNGNALFGTMAYHPNINNQPGKLYLFDPGENELTSFDMGIHIPNTFIHTNEDIFISDSLLKCTYKLSLADFNRTGMLEKSLWRDFSNEEYTPDGGCISVNGNLHIALWDGAAIGVYNSFGSLINKIEVPVPRPTNCTILDNRWMYVTSANEGMTSSELNASPLSGKTFVIDLGKDYEF